MFRRFVTSAVVVMLLVAGCGGERASSPSSPSTTGPSTSDGATTSAPATTAGSTIAPAPAPSPTEPPTTGTVTEQPAADTAMLRPDGLGPVDFGTPGDDAIEDLSAILGRPDRVEVITPGGGGCVEGAGWLDCVRDLRIVDEGRLAVWGAHGLEVALVDSRRGTWPPEPTRLQFGDWQATVAPGDARLHTAEGLYPGMTIRDLRETVPSVEFTYNEGALDSFYLDVGERGGHWGRLDWDPATAEVEGHDVRAVQAALNEHGAELAADGEWGPRSEAAWLDVLAALGIEAVSRQPWLTPEIGVALGLPPDDVAIASLEPRPAPVSGATTLPILRADGLDDYGFGDPADALVRDLESVIGPPSEDASYTPEGPGPFEYLPLGYWAAYELRVVVWDEPDLVLVLSDVPWLGDEFGEPTPGTPHLVSWETSSPRFTLDDQLAVGSSLGELRGHAPSVVIGSFDVCETEYDPGAFATTSDAADTAPSWRDLRGTTDWDWVSDLQAALNERGASLVVDGRYGTRTRAAVGELERAMGIEPADGEIDPDVVDALDLRAPDDARITALAAGYPGSC